jgi:hypothetical protein
VVLVSDTSAAALRKMTVANLFAAPLTGTVNSTAGTIATATLGTTTGTAASFTSGTLTTGLIPTLTAGTTTGTAASFTALTTGTGTAAAPAIAPSSDTNTGIFFPAADTIAFGEGGAEAVRIDSSGNVGVGNTVASTIISAAGLVSGSLVVGSGSGQPGVVIYGGASNTGSLYFADGTAGGDTFRGYVEYNHTDNFLRFGTNTLEHLRIDSSGRVGVGTSAPSVQLELSTDGAKKLSSTVWATGSDERLKTNITPADLDRCYEIIKTIPLKRYTWKNEVYSAEQVRDRRKLGWVAQDVEAVFPKAVGTNRFAYNQVYEDIVTPEVDTDGNPVLDEEGVQKTKTEKRLVSEDVIEDCRDLNADQIYAVMYGTIQKLIAKVETLEAKVAALEAA